MADKRVFSDLLDDLGTVYEKDVSPAMKRLYWEDLGDLSDEALANAAKAHRRDTDRGRYFPRPADLLAQMTRARPILPVDAAWALALESFDEARTVVWTSAIAEARSWALPIWSAGDKIGARMAFKAYYERICELGSTPEWQVSLGHDAEDRRRAIGEAVRRGLLGEEQARQLLPRPEAVESDAPRLEGPASGNVVEHPSARAAAMRRLAEIVGGDTGSETPRQRADRERRERMESAKVQARANLDALAKRLSSDGADQDEVA